LAQYPQAPAYQAAHYQDQPDHGRPHFGPRRPAPHPKIDPRRAYDRSGPGWGENEFHEELGERHRGRDDWRAREPADLDDRAIRSARVDAPEFFGSLDPLVYLDWEQSMDRYFEWHDMTDRRRVMFAKTRLQGLAQTYWLNVERLLWQRD